MSLRPLLAGLALASLMPAATLLAQPPQDQLIRENLSARDCGVDCYDTGAKRSSRTGEKLFNRGLRELQAMKYDKAAKSFGKAVRHAPDNATFNYMAGSSLYVAGRREEALPYLKKSVEVGEDAELSDKQRAIAHGMIEQIAA
jgi:tetratricopeptide (TPR) repeat protein